MRRTLPLVLGLAMLAGCRDGTVLLTFRPEVGSTYRYEVRVRTDSVVRLEGEAPTHRSEDAVIRAEHKVLAAGREGVRVRVRLQRAGSAVRTFVVRFDRAAQLEEVESVEGIDTEALGRLGLSEIFPAAAGAPPDRPLQPGDRWQINERIRLPGASAATRLEGRGRLTELDVADGHEVATIVTSSRLPLPSSRPRAGEEAPLTLEGAQVSENQATYDLADGAVRRATSITSGRFDIVLAPPAGRSGPPVEGTLAVAVRSETRRLG